MALFVVNNFQIAKQTGVLGAFYLKCGKIVSYSTSSDSGPKPLQLKTLNLSALKRGTGGRSSFNGLVVTVFGSTGFLGGHVVNKLGKIGSQVICCYRGDSYDAKNLKPCADLGQILFHFYNLRDEHLIREAVKHSNVVINLVGRNWETKNFKFDDVHVEGARRLAKISREAGVERFIHLSSLNVSPEPTPIIFKGGSKFLKSKYYGEQAVLEEFPTATIIRPADIYGQQDHFLHHYCHLWRRHLRGIPLWHKGERTIKAPVYASDVAQGIVNAILDPDTAGKIYQGIGPRRYLLSDLVDWFYLLMRKDEEWGYHRFDMRFAPLFLLKVWLTDKITTSHYIADLHKERLEREHVSAVIDEELPTLEDLGVKLTYMENQVPWELLPYQAYAYYIPEKGEYDISPPKFLDPRETI